MSIQRTQFTPLIQTIATKYALDPDLVEAIVIQESGGNPRAYRFEPQFYVRYMAKVPRYKRLPAERYSASYGLMQPLWITVHEIGYDGPPEGLFVPEVNLDYGCKKLAQLQEWAAKFKASDRERQLAVMASWNGGRADNQPGRKPLRSGRYAQQLMTKLVALKGLPVVE